MTPGASIAGKYRLLRPLGKGSMGEVWAAVHTEMRREVALKLIYGDNPDLAVRLKREAQACGRLEHPNVVRIYDIGETDDGDPFLIMQLLTGETLADRLARRRRLPPVEALWVALEIARALRAAHAADIIHRDLKPANIYLHRGADSEGEEVKVLDFGVSKILSVGDMAFTVTGALVGSPAYMSPEQARASKEIDPRADLWSLGVLLFEMLTGRRPFPSASPMGVIAEILSEPIPLVSAFVPGIDPRIDEAVSRCMTRDVDQRLQSAAEFIDLLRPVTARMELASTGMGVRTLPSLPDISALEPLALHPNDAASVASTDEDLPTQMIDREALLRSGSPQRPSPAPSTSSESGPTRVDAVPGWGTPIPPPPIPSRPSWQNSPSPAIDTMVASSELMMEREAAQAAAPPPIPPPRFHPAPTFQPLHPGSADTVSTVPLFRVPQLHGFDPSRTPLPLAWEPAPTHDRSRVALIVAVVVIVISLVLLLVLMLTQDDAPTKSPAQGSLEGASTAVVANAAPPAPPAPPALSPSVSASAKVPLAASTAQRQSRSAGHGQR
jgi:eukaryotic-like serine/threonine-protein kinase